MRWPEWTQCFGRCFGCRQGPHHQHYDAWLARERLNQVKRLEVKLADMVRENGELSARLGQAVGILDSYHSFDLDQMGLAAQGSQGGAASPIPAPPEALRQDSASRRRLAGMPASSASGSEASASARGESLGPRGSRGGSLAQPQALSHRLAMSRASMGGAGLIGAPVPAPTARVGSLQFQPTARTSRPPPPAVRQMMMGDRQMAKGDRTASEGSARRPGTGSQNLGIPSRDELDSLLQRSEEKRTRRAERTSRASLDTVVSVTSLAQGDPEAETASVVSAPADPQIGALATIGESSGELPGSSVEYEASRSLSDAESPAEKRTPRRKSLSRDSQSRLRARQSGERAAAVDARLGSFSFATTPATAPGDSPRQMAVPVTSAFHTAAQVAPPSLPAVMVGANTQPVRTGQEAPVKDAPRLATQARGQIYTSHYSPESSPFARAAARMPASDGKLPLSRHLPPS